MRTTCNTIAKQTLALKLAGGVVVKTRVKAGGWNNGD
jgi:hypothetical protein